MNTPEMKSRVLPAASTVLADVVKLQAKARRQSIETSTDGVQAKETKILQAVSEKDSSRIATSTVKRPDISPRVTSDRGQLSPPRVRTPGVEADPNLLADSSGLVWQFDIDQPGLNKRWPGLSVSAVGIDISNTVGWEDGDVLFEDDDVIWYSLTSIEFPMTISYRTANFDTTDTGWSDFTFDLTSSLIEKTFWINRSSRQIQFRLSDFSVSEGRFDIRKMRVLPPLLEENR